MPKLVTLPPQASGKQAFKPTADEIAEWVKLLGSVKKGDDWIVSDQEGNNRQAASRYGKLYETAILEAMPDGTTIQRRTYETENEGAFRFALRIAA